MASWQHPHSTLYWFEFALRLIFVCRAWTVLHDFFPPSNIIHKHQTSTLASRGLSYCTYSASFMYTQGYTSVLSQTVQLCKQTMKELPYLLHDCASYITFQSTASITTSDIAALPALAAAISRKKRAPNRK